MHAVDVLPTLLGAASLSGDSVDLFSAHMAEQGRPLDGMDMWPTITGIFSTGETCMSNDYSHFYQT